ncbi:hypothetical protein KP509_20G052400 [Ceratopteris richardii]|nr:hypothetical protein KP509_20G052400 [Ceratopteris richardii]
MYPLPDLQTLLGLEVYNTYHHHHVHRFMKWGASDDVSGRSTCTDPSHHTHTNHHKIALVETRVYTLHPTSVLPKYFQDNEVRICVSSRVLGTYSHVVVKRSSLEFVHHIVHQHDTHIQHDDYQTVFTVPSVCTQTCTRSTTQCKLHAIQGDFQHHHFHEHIHSILIRPANFIGAPNEVGEFMFLSVTRLNLLNHTVTKLQ